MTINGEAREISDGLLLTDFIEELGLGQRKIAVELNREIIRSAEWPSTTLAENDTLEIVHFVGGG